LLASYRALPYKDIIDIAILFLIDTFRDGFIEDSVMSAFTALETVKDGITSHTNVDKIVSSSRFGKIRADLASRLETLASQHGLTTEQRDAMIEKLPELQRPPVVGVVARLINELGVEWSDLWPDGVELSRALRAAFARRNALVHRGQLTDAAASRADYMRIHALTERLILRTVDCDPRWTATMAHIHGRVWPAFAD
jgi:hypothetical protein